MRRRMLRKRSSSRRSWRRRRGFTLKIWCIISIELRSLDPTLLNVHGFFLLYRHSPSEGTSSAKVSRSLRTYSTEQPNGPNFNSSNASFSSLSTLCTGTCMIGLKRKNTKNSSTCSKSAKSSTSSTTMTLRIKTWSRLKSRRTLTTPSATLTLWSTIALTWNTSILRILSSLAFRGRAISCVRSTLKTGMSFSTPCSTSSTESNRKQKKAQMRSRNYLAIWSIKSWGRKITPNWSNSWKISIKYRLLSISLRPEKSSSRNWSALFSF